MSASPGGPQDPLVQARLQEARSLFELNQRRRGRAEGTLLMATVVSVAAAVVALAARRPEVLLPLPPTVLALAALAFQQYADVTVLGAARQSLEDELLRRLGAEALVYERHVARVRKETRLSLSVRAVQSLGWATALGAAALGAALAVGQPTWVVVTYVLALAAAGAVCALSYWSMLQAGDEARRAFRGLFPA